MSACETHRFVMIFGFWRMIAFDHLVLVATGNKMRLLSAAAFLMLLAVAFAADAAPLPSPLQVEIPFSSGTLHAQLYKPDGDGPFPVVIALHGCGGLGGQSEPVQLHYRDWAEPLL